MTQNEKLGRRNNFLTDRIQVKYALMICGALGLMLILMQVYTLIFLRALIPQVSQAVSGKITELQFHLLLAGISYIIIAGILSVYMTSRIAGPVYRVQREAKKNSLSPDLNFRFKIRKNDEFQEFIGALNGMLENIQKNYGGINDKEGGGAVPSE